jgi:hypothetical protein
MNTTTTAATNPPKSKPFFRKLSLKKQKPGRLSSNIVNNSDSINSSSDGALDLPVQHEHGSDVLTMDETMLETIMANKRKRDINRTLRIEGKKIRAEVPSKEALPLVTGLSKGSTSSHSVSNTSENGGMLRTTFASSKDDRKAKNLYEDFDESSALGRRHKQAMEEYILHKQMEKTNVDSKGQSQETTSKSKSSEVLYQELSAKVITQGEDAAGNIVTFTSTGAKIISKQATGEKKQEGDIGAGGTMLGGTGKKEVQCSSIHILKFIARLTLL